MDTTFFDPSVIGDDAAKWAKRFCLTFALCGAKAIDEGTMIGWFANAIEAACDKRMRERDDRIETLTKALLDISQATLPEKAVNGPSDMSEMEQRYCEAFGHCISLATEALK
jgi:hypothetical protein